MKNAILDLVTARRMQSLWTVPVDKRQADFQNMWTLSQHPRPTVLISQGHCLVPADTYVEFVGKSRFFLAPCLRQ